MNTEQKPPLGLRPESIAAAQFNRERIREIMLALGRYLDVNMDIPEAWMDELDTRLRHTLEEHEKISPAMSAALARLNIES
jgi:hypothetical protein